MAFWTDDNRLTTNGKGNDGSAAWSYLHGMHLYVGSEVTRDVVVFKAFVESFQLSYVPESHDESFGESTIEPTTKSARFKYSVTINVPSMNDFEAASNDRKYYKLEKMIRRTYKQKSPKTGKTKYTRVNHCRVLMGNLIYNGGFDSIPYNIQSGGALNEWQMLQFYAVQGTIASVSREVDPEMGFWDHKYKMRPKAFKIKFELLMQNTYIAGGTEFPTFLPLRVIKKNSNWIVDDKGRKTGTGMTRDSRNWPFGYNAGRSDTYQDPSVKSYISNHQASQLIIEFQFQSYSLKTLKFPVYLDSLSESFGIEIDQKFASVESWNPLVKRSKFRNRKLTFNVPMFRDLDGKVTMEKIGWLFRFLIPTVSEDGTMVPGDGKLFIRFGEVLKSSVSASPQSGAKCHVNSLSIDLDLEMGVWEQPNNFCVPKGVKITLDVDIVEKWPT